MAKRAAAKKKKAGKAKKKAGKPKAKGMAKPAGLRATPSLHRIHAAILETEDRVRACDAPQDAKDSVLTFLADLRNRIHPLCATLEDEPGEMVHYFQQLLPK